MTYGQDFWRLSGIFRDVYVWKSMDTPLPDRYRVAQPVRPLYETEVSGRTFPGGVKSSQILW